MWWIALIVAAVLYIAVVVYVTIDFKNLRVGNNDYNVNDYMYEKMGLFLFVGALFYFPFHLIEIMVILFSLLVYRSPDLILHAL